MSEKGEGEGERREKWGKGGRRMSRRHLMLSVRRRKAAQSSHQPGHEGGGGKLEVGLGRLA